MRAARFARRCDRTLSGGYEELRKCARNYGVAGAGYGSISDRAVALESRSSGQHRRANGWSECGTGGFGAPKPVTPNLSNAALGSREESSDAALGFRLAGEHGDEQSEHRQPSRGRATTI